MIGSCFPNLENLVLQDSRSDLTPVITENFGQISQLDLSNCQLANFVQMMVLASLPQLVELKLCNNPLGELAPVSQGFEALKTLNLEGTQVNRLHSLDHLNTMPALKELRLSKTPLTERFGKLLRLMVTSYMPLLAEFNGGTISDRERCSSERQFVREFSDPGQPFQHGGPTGGVARPVGSG